MIWKCTKSLKCIEWQTNHQTNYHKLFNVAITLPISSATCERSVSAMRRLKTWMRSTILQERFISLELVNIEKNDTLSVLNHFANYNRRINLILY